MNCYQLPQPTNTTTNQLTTNQPTTTTTTTTTTIRSLPTPSFFFILILPRRWYHHHQWLRSAIQNWSPFSLNPPMSWRTSCTSSTNRQEQWTTTTTTAAATTTTTSSTLSHRFPHCTESPIQILSHHSISSDCLWNHWLNHVIELTQQAEMKGRWYIRHENPSGVFKVFAKKSLLKANGYTSKPFWCGCSSLWAGGGPSQLNSCPCFLIVWALDSSLPLPPARQGGWGLWQLGP